MLLYCSRVTSVFQFQVKPIKLRTPLRAPDWAPATGREVGLFIKTLFSMSVSLLMTVHTTFQLCYLTKTLGKIPQILYLVTMATWEVAQDQQTAATILPAPTHLSTAEVLTTASIRIFVQLVDLSLHARGILWSKGITKTIFNQQQKKYLKKEL